MALPYTAAEIIHATRFQLARTAEDALARRTRDLFLNARAAIRMAPRVAELMAGELGRDSDWTAAQSSAFREVANKYV
jgi:glycerol-3-phosphate dehydrogenase